MISVQHRPQDIQPIPIPRWEQLAQEFNWIEDEALRTRLYDMSFDDLYPTANSDAEREKWFRVMPYERIVEFCDREKGVLLVSLLLDNPTFDIAKRTLEVFENPLLLPIFIRALQLRREHHFKGVSVSALLDWKRTLPQNACEVLQIESEIQTCYYTHIYSDRVVYEKAMADKFAECDAKYEALILRSGAKKLNNQGD